MDRQFLEPLAMPPPADGIGDRRERVELVGPHLRVAGTIAIGRHNRLSDQINQSVGYVRLTDANLLRRNGEPTNVVVPELAVNPDEITLIGQTTEAVPPVSPATGGAADRPLLNKVPRQLIIFTPGHTLSGTAYLFPESGLVEFVNATDPRFVPMINVRAQSLADRRVISHFAFCLVNRTQIAAVALLERPSQVDDLGTVGE
jgi:hypothetical protein